jgi:hypothetical protein
VVQTLMAAQIVTGNKFNNNGGNGDNGGGTRPPGLPQASTQAPAQAAIAQQPRKRV